MAKSVCSEAHLFQICRHQLWIHVYVSQASALQNLSQAKVYQRIPQNASMYHVTAVHMSCMHTATCA